MRCLLAFIATFCFAAAARGNMLTFDTLTVPGPIPNGYGSLNWSNFSYLNSSDAFIGSDVNGYMNGTISPNNVAYNPGGAEAAISGSPFTLVSAFFTGAWKNGLQITASGYLRGVQVSQFTFWVNEDYASLEMFDFGLVDQVTFVSSGGTEAVDTNPAGGPQFAMDNMTILSPEPAGAMLSGAFGLGLVARRRRA